jgi:hypothetical protein
LLIQINFKAAPDAASCGAEEVAPNELCPRNHVADHLARPAPSPAADRGHHGPGVRRKAGPGLAQLRPADRTAMRRLPQRLPELTPYGRLFKLNGYTFTGGTSNIPPLAMMAIPNFTQVAEGVPGGLAPGFGANNDVAFTGSLFYGGKIFDHLGAFVQATYDEVPNAIHWDNTDIRCANTGELSGKELVYGISLNNNPTVNDVWNSTPAWGYPYIASQLSPAHLTTTLIEGGLAQQVLGLKPYIYWDRFFYAEAGGYRTLSPGQLSALGIPPPGTNSIDGIAPSWRFAMPAWGNNTWEVGTFGPQLGFNFNKLRAWLWCSRQCSLVLGRRRRSS